MPYYSVTIVYRDGSCQCHSGMIQDHARAMYRHANALPEVNYAQLNAFRDDEWNRIAYFTRGPREAE